MNETIEEMESKLVRYRERADAARFALQHTPATDDCMFRSIEMLIDSWDGLIPDIEAAIAKLKVGEAGVGSLR